MSKVYKGKDGKVLVGTARTSCPVTGFKVKVSANNFDTTSTADEGWDDVESSTLNASGTFEFFYPEDADVDPLNDTKLNLRPGVDVPVELVVKPGATPAQDVKLMGLAKITDFDCTHTTKGGYACVVTFKSRGKWYLPGDTYPTGGGGGGGGS